MNDVIDPQVLRALRETRHWDQQTLAATAGVDPSVVSRLERGLQQDLRASVLVALARALQSPVDALLVAEDHQHQPVFIAELTAAVQGLADLAPAHQRQLAAIVQAYLATMPD